jgi:hypothetical protein
VRGFLTLATVAACDSDPAAAPSSGRDRTAENPALDFEGALDEPRANCSPAPPEPTGDAHGDCVARINQLRLECQGLPPLARWTEGEDCADAHAEYDSTADSFHAGFADNICSPRGNAQNECPGWDSVEATRVDCLQQMWDEGPGEPFEAHGHYINMSNRAYAKVACGFFTTPTGDVWSVQNFN